MIGKPQPGWPSSPCPEGKLKWPPEFSETLFVTLANATNNALITDATGIGTIAADDPIYIHDIQGTAYYSPILAGEGISAFNTASEPSGRTDPRCQRLLGDPERGTIGLNRSALQIFCVPHSPIRRAMPPDWRMA